MYEVTVWTNDSISSQVEFRTMETARQFAELALQSLDCSRVHIDYKNRVSKCEVHSITIELHPNK